MTTPSPASKSLTTATDGPPDAPQTVPRGAMGEPKGAARKGDRTAVGSDPQQADGRYPIAWLHIRAPYGTTPTATSKCLCGRDRSAVGHRRVLALIAEHTTHRDTCPLRTPQEGRRAA